ncbi:MAG: ATP-dependent 26S proteasome regulatory subunit [uncultured archaeon A07HB70]|nr:MAG: ATP-dependent 26S proteasome regulatory subunit [uncultured archaeon A07HB70]
MSGVDVTVRAAEKRDAGRGIARLPEAIRSALGVLSGDPVVVEGERPAVVKCWPARAGVPDGTVQVDAGTRANAGVKIGETVQVSTTGTLVAADRVDLVLVDGVDADDDAVVAAATEAVNDRPVRAGQTVRVERVDATVRVRETEPTGDVRVDDSTTVAVDLDPETPADESGDPAPASGVTYEDIGGLDDELDLVREMVELPLSEPELFARVGVEPPRGVLLHGPPGTGKTLIARAVANEVDAAFFTVSGPEIVSKYKGDSEERLRETFREAREAAPSVVFFDEIDSIAGERDGDSDVENRVVGQLLSLMDGLDDRGDVVVVGATNRLDSLDPALRRGGRFDREIEIGAPNEVGRREILAVHARGVPLADDVDLDAVAARTYGFVGADLATLVKEAGMTALRRARAEETPTAEIAVKRRDVESALASVEPSAMREYVAEQPTEGFEAVGGLDDPKAALSRAVEWPLQYEPLFAAADATPPTGVLLHGPPGTGKTLLARAIAAERG